MLATATLVLSVNVVVAQESTLATADNDSDGKVTVKEFAEYAGQRLQGFNQLDAFAKKVDADGDGEISESEFNKRMEILRGMMNSGQQQDAESKEGSEKKSEDSGPHKVGDKASDFNLQSIGKKVKLSDNFGENGKPVVVVFSRANW